MSNQGKQWKPGFSLRDFVQMGGCMHRLRAYVPVGETDRPWEQEYVIRDQACVGTLHEGGSHLVTTIDGKSVLVHNTRDGKRWY